MSTTSIFNFIQIDDRVGTGGQPTAEQLRAASDEGYEAVINLAPDDADNALAGEAELVRSLGMTYRHIPVAWTNPLSEDFDTFVAAMQENAGRKMLVHCAANFRVTAFYSLYAMRCEGWTEEQARSLRAQIWEAFPGFEMDDTWRAFIDTTRARITG